MKYVLLLSNPANSLGVLEPDIDSLSTESWELTWRHGVRYTVGHIPMEPWKLTWLCGVGYVSMEFWELAKIYKSHMGYVSMEPWELSRFMESDVSYFSMESWELTQVCEVRYRLYL